MWCLPKITGGIIAIMSLFYCSCTALLLFAICFVELNLFNLRLEKCSSLLLNGGFIIGRSKMLHTFLSCLLIRAQTLSV